jgi:hypothetical protein
LVKVVNGVYENCVSYMWLTETKILEFGYMTTPASEFLQIFLILILLYYYVQLQINCNSENIHAQVIFLKKLFPFKLYVLKKVIHAQLGQGISYSCHMVFLMCTQLQIIAFHWFSN